MRIVGVVGDVHDGGAGTAIGPTLYIPYAQNNSAIATFVVKSSGEPGSLTRALERAIWSVDRGQPVERAAAMSELLSSYNATQRFKTLLLSAFAALGAALAAIGIYGVAATMVAERAKEMAVRVTLGAKRSDILRVLLAETGRWVIVGVVIGALTTFAAMRLGARWMTDGVELGVLPSVVVMMAIAVLVLGATWAPVRRATRISLTELLRR
jgi:putative ABC transport system permease protein